MKYTRVVNGGGWVELKLTDDFDWLVLGLDRLIEIWRAPSDETALKWQCTGFLRKWEVSRRRNVTKVVLEGPTQTGLLDRKVIAYKGGQSETEKNAAADDVMKELVDEAMGPSAGNDPYGRSRIQVNFTISADVAAGVTFDGDMQWQRLMDVLQDISDHSHSKGTPMYFDVVQMEPANFQFRTYVEQRGLDRRSGPGAITFGLEFGNFSDPKWIEDWSKEQNIIYGLGQGEGQNRTIDPEKDVGRIYRTIWNRQEATQDARGEKTLLGVAKKAFARLVESRPRRKLSGRLQSVPGSLYDLDWGFGDRVNAIAFGFEFDGMVQTVTITVSQRKGENVDARIEAEYVNLG